MVNLDLCSLFRVMKAFGKVMVEAGYGRIINIASAMGMVGNLGVPLAGYQAAKGGVINLTRAAAAEWATQGVTVNNICPGMFPSESNGADLMEESQTFIKAYDSHAAGRHANGSKHRRRHGCRSGVPGQRGVPVYYWYHPALRRRVDLRVV